MKWFKIIILTCSALFGFSKAYTEAHRVTFIYVNKCSPYFKLTQPYDASKCVEPSSVPCAYESSVDLGATTTKATLTAAGAIPRGLNRCYRE